jgi:hypothetical protein
MTNPDIKKPQFEEPQQARFLALICTSKGLPKTLEDRVKETVKQPNIVVGLFCRADSYSETMHPLCFGVGMLLRMNAHGQITRQFIYHDDTAKEISMGAVEIVNPMNGWQNVFEGDWPTIHKETWK